MMMHAHSPLRGLAEGHLAAAGGEGAGALATDAAALSAENDEL